VPQARDRWAAAGSCADEPLRADHRDALPVFRFGIT
jgi:hypothetical protein